MNELQELEKKLIKLETKYSDNKFVSEIRNVRSKHESQKNTIKHRGADRMSNCNNHNYSKWYSIFIQKYQEREIILCEVGILTGVGLSIWCDIFNKSTVIGFDIDIGIFERNKNNLISLGAFSKNTPNIYEFDQFENNTDYIKSYTHEKKISIVIDDGNHTNKANLQTFKSFLPLLADDFVYIIEDNPDIQNELKKIYNNKFYIYYKNKLTVICSKNDGIYISSLNKYLLK